MTKTFLTDTKIQNPKNAGKELTDTIPNLTIKLNKCGGGAWIFRFIDPENRKQRPKYYPVLSIDDARKIAIEYNALVKQGINPKQSLFIKAFKAALESPHKNPYPYNERWLDGYIYTNVYLKQEFFETYQQWKA